MSTACYVLRCGAALLEHCAGRRHGKPAWPAVPGLYVPTVGAEQPPARVACEAGRLPPTFVNAAEDQSTTLSKPGQRDERSGASQGISEPYRPRYEPKCPGHIDLLHTSVDLVKAANSLSGKPEVRESRLSSGQKWCCRCTCFIWDKSIVGRSGEPPCRLARVAVAIPNTLEESIFAVAGSR